MPEMKKIWDNYIVIGEVKKSAGIKFVVAAAVRDSVRYINIREFYIRKRDNVWMPGRDGITMPLIVPLEKNTVQLVPYAEMMALLQKTADVAYNMPMIDKNNAVYIPKK